MENNKFIARGRIILDDDITESHRASICHLICNMNDMIPNKEEVAKALEFPGLTAVIHVVTTSEETHNMLIDMNDSDYLVYFEC